MKQLGNLAVVCAKRCDVVLLLCQSAAKVHIGGSEGDVLSAHWDDDEKISEIIRDLNFGRFNAIGSEVSAHE